MTRKKVDPIGTRRETGREAVRRREFLTRLAVATGATAAGLARVGAAETAAPAAPPSGTVSLPAPPSREVFLERMDGARARLRTLKAGALLEPAGTNLKYLTGLAVGRSERLIALLLPAEGPPVMICPAFERDLIAGAPAGIAEIEVWEEDEDPVELTIKCLKKMDVPGKALALGGSIWYDDFIRLHQADAKIDFISTTPIVGAMRETKSDMEVGFMRAAIDITEKAIAAALTQVREGMREDELEGLISRSMKEQGASGGGLVQFGPRSAVPHNPTSDRRLAAGDVILIDVGAQVHGYWSDISRPAVFGQATGRMKEIHGWIRKAQDGALAAMKPKASCAGLDNLVRSTLVSEGYRKYLKHRLGHGIGLDGHEPPYLSGGYNVGLAEGNVVTLEPGIYSAGDYGIRIEDMAVVTATGASYLSHPPEKLFEI